VRGWEDASCEREVRAVSALEQAPRRATDPSRGFEPAGLDALRREVRQALVLAVLAHRRLQIVEVRPRVDFDELLISVNTGLRQRTAGVRIYYRSLEDDDLRDAEQAVVGGALADLTVIQAASGNYIGLHEEAISVVGPEELIEALEGCPLVSWSAGVPAVDRRERTQLRALETEAWLESDAFSWLAVVARNKVPYGLGELQLSPDALLERASFRVLTHVLRFGGERLGEAQRGQALPDALLTLPGRPQIASLLDTKAARDGYIMSRDDQRALEEYVTTFKSSLAAGNIDLRWVVIVSSVFPGREGPRHPYHARDRALQELGVRLVYLPAAALATLALTCEEHAIAPATREKLDWPSLFDMGQIDVAVLIDRLLNREDAR
jgi:hypothetical protein